VGLKCALMTARILSLSRRKFNGFAGDTRLSLERTVEIVNMKNRKEKATLKANQARGLQEELAQKIASFMGKEENRTTEIPGVSPTGGLRLPRRAG
jgi:hypothetical protein